MSERHTRWIIKAYRKKVANALSHGNGGRRPTNATTEAPGERRGRVGPY